MRGALKISLMIAAAAAIVAVAAFFVDFGGDGPVPPAAEKREKKARPEKPGDETAGTPPRAESPSRKPWDEAPGQVSFENVAVSPYEGSGGGFLPVINAVSAIGNAVPSAVRILNDRSGIFPASGDRIDIIPVDSGSIEEGSLFDVRETGEGRFSVRIPVEQLAFRALPVEELEAAAVAEVLLTKRVASFSSAPGSFRKGTAAYFSGLATYLEKVEVLKAFGEDGGPRYGLESEGRWLLLNGCLSARFLANGFGKDILRAVLKEMDAGAGFRDAVEKASGLPFGEFDRRYCDFARNFVSSMTVNRQLFKGAVSRLRDLREEEAEKLLESFLAAHPTDVFAGEALYYLGYARYRLGRYDAAESVFNELLLNRSFDTVSHGKARYFLGRCYELKGYRSLALEEYRFCSLDGGDLLRRAADMRVKELEK